VQKQFLRLQDLEQIIGLSKSTIYSMIDLGEFPRQIKLSERAVGWCSVEIQAWIDERKAARRGD
jgi:prophage regulatory protein